MINSKIILCLCDGGYDIGFGHASRVLSIAEAFAESGWHPQFTGRLHDGSDNMVRAAGFKTSIRAMITGTEDPEDTIRICRSSVAAAQVVDSYSLRPGYLRKLGRAAPILLIDDYGDLDEYPCATILNPGFNQGDREYPFEVPVLTGPGFIPLRRAFRRLRAKMRVQAEKVRRVLVFLGGGDQKQMTKRVVRALKTLDVSLTLRVVVGQAYPELAALVKEVSAFAPDSRVLVQLPDLAEEMAAADLCIVAGGSTKYEAAYLGVPCLAIPINESQRPETELFDDLGLAINCGLADELSDEALARTVNSMLKDAGHLAAMSRRGLTTFPNDPTRPIIEAFVKQL
ncbi:MAG: UDP-2,4-diacetamido-2,4,6-trideoxy-beta-L-altropyranose hydrolase [Proteobacteria bacterium]|nr:UDP-2,4-diacetamido-2,4,6-trideoxy-beta-L-altropyranose hydrolase [Pseudomonadota bacterium]